MTEHVDIADGERHEPKGITGASTGQVYKATGGAADSGSWSDMEGLRTNGAAGSMPVSDGANALNMIRVQGWGHYEDSRATVGSPIYTLTPSARTKWECNGAGLTVEKDPSDLTVPLWDTALYKHVPIANFDTYHIRGTFTMESFSASSYVEIELDIGGSIGVIWAQTVPLLKSGAQKISFTVPVYTSTTYIANGGTIYITYTGTGNPEVYKSAIFIVRESKNYV